MNPYTELPGFEHVVLEESYVLNICATPGAVTIDLDVALDADHDAYVSPPPGEVECFKRGHVRFERVGWTNWAEQGAPPATDASGETDYGHIDSFVWDGDLYRLHGDFGRIELSAQSAILVLDP
jgi:hypothetical protein